jgi:hypothetical protein
MEVRFTFVYEDFKRLILPLTSLQRVYMLNTLQLCFPQVLDDLMEHVQRIKPEEERLYENVALDVEEVRRPGLPTTRSRCASSCITGASPACPTTASRALTVTPVAKTVIPVKVTNCLRL